MGQVRQPGGTWSRVSESQAADEARIAGLIPQEPYPGKAATRWTHRCAECGYEICFSLSRIRKGARCSHLRSKRDLIRQRIMRDSGFQPVSEFPRTKAGPVLVRCVHCGEERYRPVNWMESGGKCLCAKIPAFRQEMLAAGYSPQVPYPGTARKAWRSVCRTCGATRRISLETVRAGKLCKHGGKRKGTHGGDDASADRGPVPGV